MNDRRTILLWAILVIGLLCVASSAAAVALVVGDGAGVAGQTVQVPVYLTDAPDPIYSVELELSWYQYYFTLVGVETAGTESAAWSMEWSAVPVKATWLWPGPVPSWAVGSCAISSFLWNWGTAAEPFTCKTR